MGKEKQSNYIETKVKCATCDHEFTVGSTMEKLTIEACNECHPAYTGESKSKKAAGRVEQFNKKFGL